MNTCLRRIAVHWCQRKQDWVDSGQFGVAVTLQGVTVSEYGVELG